MKKDIDIEIYRKNSNNKVIFQHEWIRAESAGIYGTRSRCVEKDVSLSIYVCEGASSLNDALRCHYGSDLSLSYSSSSRFNSIIFAKFHRKWSGLIVGCSWTLSRYCLRENSPPWGEWSTGHHESTTVISVYKVSMKSAAFSQPEILRKREILFLRGNFLFSVLSVLKAEYLFICVRIRRLHCRLYSV